MHTIINPLTPNDHYNGRTATLTSKRCILYIYSTNIFTEYFKHGMYSSCFSLQNAVCCIILTYLVPVLFTFYIQGVLKLKKNNTGAKRLNVWAVKSVLTWCLCAWRKGVWKQWRYSSSLILNLHKTCRCVIILTPRLPNLGH